MDDNVLDDAATQALEALKGYKVEYFTALTNKDGNILTAHPETSHNNAHGRVKLMLDGQLVAIIHNHPDSNPKAIQFSDDDKAQARRAGVPSYIVTSDGSKRKFDPISNKEFVLP